MRTKTLLLTAAISAVGLGASMGQAVFSVNAVGFVKVTVPKGFSMIANPLDNKSPNGNTVSNLFAAAPDGTTIFKFNPATGTFSINQFSFGDWTDNTATLVPGEGAFIQNTGTTPFDVVFVGDVEQGSGTTPLTNNIPAGFSIKSSQVPQSARLDTVGTAAGLGFPVAENDTVYQFNNATGAYTTHIFQFGDWDSAPVPAVGESFFVQKAAPAVWTRNFNVNQ